MICRTKVLAFGLTAVLVSSADDARAGPCDGEQPEAGAPVRVPHGPAYFGVLPEACAATSVSANAQLGLLIAEADYYGQLHVAGGLRGRLELPGGSWLSAELPGPDYWYLVNATVEADRLSLAAMTVGWHLPIRVAEPFQIAPYVRALLPTETIFENATRYGFEHGVAAVAKLHSMLELMGGYAVPLLLTDNHGTTHSVLMPSVVADVGFRPWDWVELAAGAALRVVPPDEEPFESFDVRAAIRVYPWAGSFLDLAAAFPLGGRDRSLVAAGVSLGWIFAGTDEPDREPPGCP
jgi:hypothetical protein